MKISLMIHTASRDDFLNHHGINSYFESVLICLRRQTFTEFEFIYIDTYYEENKEQFKRFCFGEYFPVKHVPIHPNHRYWYNLGYTYISAAKNTGIIHADGELVITCDDAEFFSDNFLQKYWDYYAEGFLLYAAHKQLRSIQVVDGKITFPIEGDVYTNDTRLTSQEIILNAPSNWTYAGSSFTLHDALVLNGFNELMDGNKGSEDCDFGVRLGILGRKFAFDQNVHIYILNHKSYSPMVRTNVIGSNIEGEIDMNHIITEFAAVDNRCMIMCARDLFDIQANMHTLTDKHIEIINKITMHFRGFTPFSLEHMHNTQVWLNTPTFNLKQEREALRLLN